MVTGRPTSYKKEFIDAAKLYLSSYKDAGIEVVPTIEGLARFLHVSKVSIYTWAKENEDFLNALDEIKAEQGVLLQNNGLAGKFQPMITKLMLSANHGMAEKSETDVTSGGEKINGVLVELVHVKAKNPDTSGV